MVIFNIKGPLSWVLIQESSPQDEFLRFARAAAPADVLPGNLVPDLF